MKNFFSSPNFALRDLVIAWLSGGTNNLHFATHFSAQKVANVKNYLYFCTRFRVRQGGHQLATIFLNFADLGNQKSGGTAGSPA